MRELFKKIPLSESPLEYNYKPGYMRVFNQMHSAAFLILIEQLAIQDRKMMLYQMLTYLDKNPFHNNDPMKIFYYRHCYYHLRCLIAKLYAGLNTQQALQLFYDKIGQSLRGFALALQHFTLGIFEKAGFAITTFSYKTNYEVTRTGNSKYELILIEEEEYVYGILLQEGPIEFAQEVKSRKQLLNCSVCNIPKQGMANNLFCNHKYCIHCMKIYFYGTGEYTCPIIGCNAKVISRLLRIKDENNNSRPQSAQKIVINRKQIIETSTTNQQLIDPNWPPIFTGTHIPNYIESQFIQMRKIMELKLEDQSLTIRECIANTLYCGQCLISLQGFKKMGKCTKHYKCLSCCLFDECLLC